MRSTSRSAPNHDDGPGTLARSERFELPTLGFEVRCSIQLSYERKPAFHK